LSPEVIDRYVKAGRTVKEIRSRIVNLVREGRSFLDICEDIEETTREKGCEPAFPCNIGVNEVAAHYTASVDDQNVIPADSVVKLDLGAHVDGYVADSAVTVILNPEYEPMLIAAEEALDRALKIISPGTKIRDVSMTIQRTIAAYGYQPISNLCGHGIKLYIVHASPSIPNVASPFLYGKLESDNVYAIEPFVTTKDAAAVVVDGPCGNIYHLTKLKRPKDENCEKLFDRIYSAYRTLPFTTRWILKETSNEASRSLERLLERRHVEAYPVFYERTGKPVVQAEHSILLTEKDVILLT